MYMQQNGRFGQNTDTASTDPIQHLAKDRERVRVTARPARVTRAAHAVLPSGRA
jgi:hypothetical protein